jgi:hypothetical protein
MSVINNRVEVQVAKSEAPDASISFPLRDQQYQKFSDNNQGNYSGNNILFDLNSIANSQQFLSFADSFIVIPVVEHIQFTGVATNAVNTFSFQSQRTKLISCMKGSACSIMNGLQLEVNNEQILSFTNGSHVPMEFSQISSYDSDDFDLGVANDSSLLESVDSNPNVKYFRNAEVSNIYSAAPTGSPWYSASTAATVAGSYMTTTHTTNAGYYKKLSKMVSNARNDIVTAFYDPTLYADRPSVQAGAAASTLVASQLQNSRISYCDVSNSVAALQSSGEVCRFFYYLKLPLPLLHDFFKQAPLMKGIQIRLTLYVHLPLTYTYQGTSIRTTGVADPPTTASSTQPVTETLVNTTGYMPFAFSYPGPESTSIATVQGTADATFTYTINAGIASTRTPAGALVSHPMTACEFWGKLVTLSAPAETALLKEPRKKIVFQDFQRIQQATMVRIASQASLSWNVHSGIRRPRGLLIASESYQLPGSTSIPFSASALVHTPGVNGLPYFTYSNLQVRLGGKNIWNWNMQYGYDLFEREIRGLNSVTGNMENALRTGKQISFVNWLKQNGYIFVDLSKHVESEDNSYFSIDLDLYNPFAVPLGITCYVFYEKDISINVQTGQLFA